MSKIDDILATMPEDTIPGMTDEVIVIDPTTRQMSIPGSELIFGVESDAHSERKYFIAPRVVGDNVDLASSFIRVNYRNGNGEMDFSLVDDVVVIDDKVLFSWKLSGKVTQYRGMVAFLVYAVGQDGVAWHTTLASGLVLEGLEPDIDGAVAQTEDAVVALINMVNNQTVAVDNAGVRQITAILNEGADQVNAVKTAAEAEKSAAMAEIDAKGANTLATIPDDYTALSEAVAGLVCGHAPGIVCEAEGSAISISDASDNPIKNLRIFGKSTQDGTPTPDAPVEIKSVENPVVTVAGKNLLNPEAVKFPSGMTERDGDLFTTTFSTGGIHVKFDQNIKPGKYTFTIFPDTEIACGVYAYSLNNDQLYVRYVNPTNSAEKFEFEANEEFYIALGGYSNYSTFKYKVMLEVGWGSRTNYEPYKAIQTVAITNTLHGSPVTSGGNYIDSNGQQWICDEVDLERGVYVQRIAQVRMNDSLSLKFGTHTNGTPYCRLSDIGLPITRMLRSDRYISVGWSDVEGNAYVTGDTIFVVDGRFTDAETGTTILNKESPLFLCRLTTPIETPLTETEIASFRTLHTNKPNTTILNDAGAHMAVEYVADTKLYIDNKITALISGV